MEVGSRCPLGKADAGARHRAARSSVTSQFKGPDDFNGFDFHVRLYVEVALETSQESARLCAETARTALPLSVVLVLVF